MVDLDEILNRLAARPEPARLVMIDDAVLVAVAEGAAPGLDRSAQFAAVACLAALGLGMASIGLPVASAQAAAADVLAFGSAATMAPSTLLLGLL